MFPAAFSSSVMLSHQKRFSQNKTVSHSDHLLELLTGLLSEYCYGKINNLKQINHFKKKFNENKIMQISMDFYKNSYNFFFTCLGYWLRVEYGTPINTIC